MFISKMKAKLFQLFQLEASCDRLLSSSRARADIIMLWMCVFLLSICVAVSPVNETMDAVLAVGLPTALLAWWFSHWYAGKLVTRIYMSCAFMTFTGLLIHQLHGDIEAHFAAFGLIGVLLFYRDWRCIAAATTFIYLHHLVLGFAQTQGINVYVFDDPRFWLLFGQHVAYFLPFVGMMGYLSVWLRIDASEKVEVIELTQSIADNQFSDTELGVNSSSPLVRSVVDMKHQLQDLIRLLPVPIAIIRLLDDKLINSNAEWKNKFGTCEEDNFADHDLWKTDLDWTCLNVALTESNSRMLQKVKVELTDVEGNTRYCELSLFRNHQSNGDVAIVLAQDVTDYREKELRISKLAYRDLLTDLPNRAALNEELDAAMSRCKRGQESFGIAMLDLDGFKMINDTYGHGAGDRVLRKIGYRLAENTPAQHLVARIGGDEFVVLFLDVASTDLIAPIADRYIEALQQPVQIKDGVTVKLGCSMGVVHLTDSINLSVSEAMNLADNALYTAKAAGKNCWRLSSGLLQTTEHDAANIVPIGITRRKSA